MILKNISPSDDPVGYTTAGSFIIPAIGDRPRSHRGLGRHLAGRPRWQGALDPSRGPGDERPDQRARWAVRPRPGTDDGPPPTHHRRRPRPTAQPYGPLTVTTGCQEISVAPLMVTGSAAPDLHLEFAPTESFSTVFANERLRPLATRQHLRGQVQRLAFPERHLGPLDGSPSVKAHADEQGLLRRLDTAADARRPPAPPRASLGRRRSRHRRRSWPSVIPTSPARPAAGPATATTGTAGPTPAGRRRMTRGRPTCRGHRRLPPLAVGRGPHRPRRLRPRHHHQPGLFRRHHPDQRGQRQRRQARDRQLPHRHPPHQLPGGRRRGRHVG